MKQPPPRLTAPLTQGRPEGTPLLVRAFLVGHGPKGQPAVALKTSEGGPLALVWIDPNAILHAEDAPGAESEDPGAFMVHGHLPVEGGFKRFVVMSPEGETLMSGFSTPELAARWAVEHHADITVRLGKATAEAMGRGEDDRTLHA